MTHRDDLEKNIRESYDLIRRYEALLLWEKDPAEQSGTRQKMERQWDLLREWLVERLRMGGDLPPDLAEIAGTLDMTPAARGPAGDAPGDHGLARQGRYTSAGGAGDTSG